MASISATSNGFRTLQFFDRDGTRKTIRLGKVNQKAAQTIKAKVEELLACAAAGVSWSRELSMWVGGLGDGLARKLAAKGLIPPRQKSTLGDFLEAFLKKRAGAKPNSLKNYKAAVGKLLAYFGRDVDLRCISPGKAEEWALALTEMHAQATAGRLVKFARQFFNLAIRGKLLAENPFEGIKAKAQANESRKFFVSLDVASQILDACPDAEWRLIFALARYGGLRCPSEVLSLKWTDVIWDKGRILVHAPKTEHHEGGGDRVVPIFPELLPYLRKVFEQAQDGAVHVITRYREAGANLRTQLVRIIKKAGLKPWTKPFQNLRASRETELVARFPIHVVCAWIGNSERIAAKHYLQVTEEDFERATCQTGQEKSGAGGGAAESAAQALQKALRHAAAPSCTSGPKSADVYSGNGFVQDGAGRGSLLQNEGLHPAGVEPATYGFVDQLYP